MVTMGKRRMRRRKMQMGSLLTVWPQRMYGTSETDYCSTKLKPKPSRPNIDKSMCFSESADLSRSCTASYIIRMLKNPKKPDDLSLTSSAVS